MDRYWNWALDWEDLKNAPIWDATLGFGGDGNASEPSVADGNCVTDGPFGRLTALFVDSAPQPHCLSRSFQDVGPNIRPEAVERVLQLPDYESFNLGLEEGPHRDIPYSIRGDFYIFTAPYGTFQSHQWYPCRV